ncbi:MAG: hypothetical protein ACO25K_07605 [Candidatus Fonsibacter ubiquis]
MILSIFLTIVFTLLSALYDAKLFLSFNFFTNHLPRFIFRALIIFLITYIFTKNKDDWMYTFLMYLLNSSIFYLLFDYALNLFWGMPILRIGQTALIDRLWLLLGGSVAQLVFKIALIAAMIFFLQKCGKKDDRKFDNIKNNTYICV